MFEGVVILVRDWLLRCLALLGSVVVDGDTTMTGDFRKIAGKLDWLTSKLWERGSVGSFKSLNAGFKLPRSLLGLRLFTH